ncbi:tripartite tricarboxylate transporter TctB family protein [Aidingimonas halophila]|nr:tripartite tricarboxylate transporter TctB family protein [Aidingimonas halophila]
MKSRYWPEFVFGIVGAAGAVWLLNEAASFPPRSSLFPTALLWCLLAVTAIMAIQAAYRGWLRRDEADAPEAKAGGLLAPSVLLAGAGVTLSAFGFYITAPLVIFAFHTLHAHRSGEGALARPSLTRGLLLAALATLVMYLTFDVLIGLPAPSGTLF